LEWLNPELYWPDAGVAGRKAAPKRSSVHASRISKAHRRTHLRFGCHTFVFHPRMFFAHLDFEHKGLFAFNTDSEIIECNTVRDFFRKIQSFNIVDLT
jgi:hypothetical protein